MLPCGASPCTVFQLQYLVRTASACLAQRSNRPISLFDEEFVGCVSPRRNLLMLFSGPLVLHYLSLIRQ